MFNRYIVLVDLLKIIPNSVYVDININGVDLYKGLIGDIGNYLNMYSYNKVIKILDSNTDMRSGLIIYI